MKTLAYWIGVVAGVGACTNPIPTTITELGTNGPDTKPFSAAALDVSDSGRIVGYRGSGQAAEFLDHGEFVLFPRPEGFSGCQANAVANDGTAVGTCDRLDANNDSLPGQAVYWDASRTLHFIAPNLDIPRTALDINEHGVVLGHSRASVESSVSTPYIYDIRSGVLTELPVLANSNTVAESINDAGDIVGVAYFYPPNATAYRQAIQWSRGTLAITILAAPPGCDAAASHITNQGVIVGRICSAFSFVGGRAAVWSSATAVPVSLAAPPNLPGYALVGYSAVAANDDGFVVGGALDRVEDIGRGRGLVWTPDGSVIDLGSVSPRAINASALIVGTRSDKAVQVVLEQRETTQL